MSKIQPLKSILKPSLQDEKPIKNPSKNKTLSKSILKPSSQDNQPKICSGRRVILPRSVNFSGGTFLSFSSSDLVRDLKLPRPRVPEFSFWNFCKPQPQPDPERFWEACISGDFKTLTQCRKIDLNRTYGSNKQSLLHGAVLCGHFKTAIWLMDRMDQNVILHARDDDGETAFSLACLNDYVYLAALILKKGQVNIECINHNGKTPLEKAKRNNNDKLISFLISLKADTLILRDKLWFRELCKANKTDLLELLLVEGLIPLKQAEELLGCAAQKGSKETVEMFLKHKIKTKCLKHPKILVKLCAKGNLEMIEWLLCHKYASVKHPYKGKWPIHKAKKAPNKEAVCSLLLEWMK